MSIGKQTVGFDSNGKPLKTLLIQAEDSIRTCIKNRDGTMQKLTPEEKALAYENFHITPRLKGMSGNRLIDALERYHEKYKYDLVIFNPLSRFSSHIDPSDPQQVMEWIDQIECVMEKLNCSGIAVMPTPKQGVAQRKNRTDTAYSIYGSAKWGDAMRETIELREAKLDGWMTLLTEKRTDDWGWKMKYIHRSNDPTKPMWIEASDTELNIRDYSGSAQAQPCWPDLLGI